jgi:hypothetical protein
MSKGSVAITILCVLAACFCGSVADAALSGPVLSAPVGNVTYTADSISLVGSYLEGSAGYLNWSATEDTMVSISFDYLMTSSTGYSGNNGAEAVRVLTNFPTPYYFKEFSYADDQTHHFEDTILLTAANTLGVGGYTTAFPDGMVYITNISVSASTVPIPGALLLFAPGLLGLITIRRKFQK